MALFEFTESRSVQEISDIPNFDKYFSLNQSKSKVNRTTAERLAAVYACEDAISNDISNIPIQLKKKTGDKVETITNHPAVEKLKLKPNNDMNAKTLRRTRSNHNLNDGNSYIFIESSMINPVKNLWLLNPEEVEVFRTKPGNGRRGILKYKVSDGIGRPKIYDYNKIIHLKGKSWNGIIGESVITSHAREVLGIGLDMDKFISNFFQEGMNPGGVFTHPSSLGENKESWLKALKKRFASGKKRMPMTLEDGMTYTPYEIKMADQQFLELMKVNKVDICGIYGVPQSRISISDSNTNYNNSEQESKRYVQSGLVKWAIQDEQEMNLKILSEDERKAGYYFKYNFSSLLRGDSKDRSEVHYKYWQMGYPLNRILEKEDLNPVDGGDSGRVQINTIALEDADDFHTSESKTETKSLQNREVRNLEKTIAHRKRVQSRFAPLINDAAQKLVNREALAIKKESKKQSGERSASDMRTWLDDFYSDFGKYIDKDLSKILRTYAESIQEAVAGEVGEEVGVSDELQVEIDNYIDGFKEQYIGSSRGQMLQQLEIGLEAIDQRADEWHEKRADKVEDSESNGLSNMVASFTIAAAGLSPTWRNTGAKTCVFCTQMNGKKIKRYGDSFLKKDTTLNGGDSGNMTVRTTKYPPLHNGCDCVIASG